MLLPLAARPPVRTKPLPTKPRVNRQLACLPSSLHLIIPSSVPQPLRPSAPPPLRRFQPPPRLSRANPKGPESKPTISLPPPLSRFQTQTLSTVEGRKAQQRLPFFPTAGCVAPRTRRSVLPALAAPNAHAVHPPSSDRRSKSGSPGTRATRRPSPRRNAPYPICSTRPIATSPFASPPITGNTPAEKGPAGERLPASTCPHVRC
jgi:hypothetical protein